MSLLLDPNHVDLTTTDKAMVLRYWADLENGDGNKNEYIKLRIGAIFIILVLSTSATVAPPWLKKWEKCRIVKESELFARYFGAGVILSTAHIQ
jgi:solute carrier family 39 (zinc transporter), member 1/2/3